MSRLDDGLIPPKTECPFVKECGYKQANTCNHLGIEHQRSFSCAMARLFDIRKVKL